MFLTHIFLADVITEENMKKKWFLKKLLEMYFPNKEQQKTTFWEVLKE